MYEYVAKSVVKPYKAYCQSLLNSLKDNLKKKEGISVEIELIGSVASNMVTRNGKEPFDLDYNIVAKCTCDMPRAKKYKCLSLLEDEWF